MPPTLAYRSAAATGEGPLADKLRREDVLFRVRWVCVIALGLILLWTAVTLIAWFCFNLRRRVDAAVSWPAMLAGCALVVMPILFAIEYVTRGKFLESAAGGPDLSGGFGVSRHFAFSYCEGLTLLLLVEVFLWGPRMIMAAGRTLRAASAFATFSPAAGAAILSTLLRHDDGQPVADVMRHAQLDSPAFADALAYLAFHDYVGIAKDGTRVWLNTDTRNRLSPTFSPA